MRIAWKVRVAGSLFMPGVMAERLAHHRGELGGAGQRARGDDRAGDLAGARLLAIVADDAGDLGLVGLVEEFGGGLARLAHPHVERAVVGESEAALGLVELHRRHADVERHAVDRQQVARRRSACSIWLKRSSIRVRRGSGTSDGPFAIASGSRSKPITRPAPAPSRARA